MRACLISLLAVSSSGIVIRPSAFTAAAAAAWIACAGPDFAACAAGPPPTPGGVPQQEQTIRGFVDGSPAVLATPEEAEALVRAAKEIKVPGAGDLNPESDLAKMLNGQAVGQGRGSAVADPRAHSN